MTILSREVLHELTIEPTFRISEVHAPALVDKKENSTFRAIISYQVVEKTKSFITLKIKDVIPFPSKRII